MSSASIRILRELFHRACDEPPSQLPGFLDRECGHDADLRRELEDLLASRDGEHLLQWSSKLLGSVRGFMQEQIAAAPNALGHAPLASVGSFQIEKEIGRGGMGVVYLAVQVHPPRKVALKVVHPWVSSPAALRRFAFEAESLASLDHPGIASIYAVGTTDEETPRPFIAMQFVEGHTLEAYVGQPDLTIRERLQILAEVCDAVHHAHQKGIIHRDLKPGNIMIDAKRRPRILDFGVACSADANARVTLANEPQLTPGTPRYMSPEQARGGMGPLDIRSDVYSLGVIGFELVSGALPNSDPEDSASVVLSKIARGESRRLSSVNTRLRGDLEAVLSKALENDRGRRYQSASALAEDLRRILAFEPVSARPAGTAYWMMKFGRRHRALVAAACIAFLALIGGLGATSVAMWRARAAEAGTSRVLAFVEGMLGGSIRDLGGEAKLHEVLDLADAGVADQFRDNPTLEARVRNTLGTSYAQLGLYPKAASQLERALVLLQPVLGEESPEMDMVSANYAAVLRDAGDLDRACTILRGTLARNQRRFGREDQRTVRSMGNLAQLLLDMRVYEEAKSLAEQALSIQRQHESMSEDVLVTLETLLSIAYMQDDFAKAANLGREALALGRRLFGDEDPRTLTAMSDLSIVLLDARQLPEAEQLSAECVQLMRKIQGLRSLLTLKAMVNHARILTALDQFAIAEELLREVLPIQSELLGSAHDLVLETQAHLAWNLAKQGKFDEATSLLTSVVAVRSESFGADHENTRMVQKLLENVRRIEAGAADAREIK